MADINVILQSLKTTIADLTVDNAILRSDVAERDEIIRQLQEEQNVRTEAIPADDSDD